MKTITLITLLALILSLSLGCISPELRTARIAVNERDYDRALAALEAEEARMPGNAEVYYLIGMCHEKKGDLEQMAEAFRKSLDASDQFRDKIEQSRRRFMARFFAAAETAYDRVDTLETVEDYEGRSEDIKAQWTLALAYLDSGIIVDPREVEYYRQAAITSFNAGLGERAMSYATNAVELEPAGEVNIPMREVLVAVSQRLEDQEATIKWAQRMMADVDPLVEPEPYLRGLDALILVLVQKGEMEAATQKTEEASRLFPENVDIKENLAVLLTRQKDYEAALALYKQVLAIAPDHFDANLSAGTILANENRYEEAIPYLEKAHTMQPDNIIAVQNLMAAYYNTGDETRGMEMKAKYDKLSGNE